MARGIRTFDELRTARDSFQLHRISWQRTQFEITPVGLSSKFIDTVP